MSDLVKPLALIVDDEPQIRRLLTVTLEANGFRVLSAVNGQDGLVLIAQHRPAVVVLDLGLPDLPGQEVLRHASKQEEQAVFQAGNLVVDLASRRVTMKSSEVNLTVTEYNLLRLLVRHAGKVLRHRQLLREVWGPGHDDHTHYLRVYIARLREKIEADPARPELIVTEPGVGYRLLPR